MLTSLALIFLFGLGCAAVAKRLGLPRIVGMLLCGIALGPHALGWLDPKMLSISSTPVNPVAKHIGVKIKTPNRTHRKIQIRLDAFFFIFIFAFLSAACSELAVYPRIADGSEPGSQHSDQT